MTDKEQKKESKCIKIKNVIKRIKDGIITKKIKELYILVKAFLKAVLDIFIIKKYDDTYVSLTPIKNADEDGSYCDALKYAVDNRDIKNIAITGNYGSGKSSVIKTFFNKLENKKYNPIYVSLAAFNKNDYIEGINEQALEEQKKKQIQSRNEFYHTLEKSILQQLLYQASKNEVPLSRFKRISKHSKWLLNIATVGVIASICMLIFIIFPNSIDKMINNYNIIKLQIQESYIQLLLIISIITIYIIMYKILFFLSQKVNISKFKIKDAEVEIDNKPESIFNKYLDEIIYFFQVTNHNIVVIEDLDRYEGNASFIFQKLRELNTLINSSEQVKYEIDFIYAIKDDFFENYEERTKFFDYIIPIIPVSSKMNSNEIIWKRLEVLKQKGKLICKFNKDFIDDIAVLIEDKRLIDNIINEFIIYKNKIDNKYMDDKQLFTIIMYKNIYPFQYAELQLGRGNIVNIFNHKKIKIKQLIDKLNEDKKQLNKNKEQVLNETLNSIKELKYTLISSIYDYFNTNYLNYERIFKFNTRMVKISEFLNSSIDYNQIKESNIRFMTNSYSYIDIEETEVFNHFGNKSMFLKRWENIEKGKDVKLQNLQSEIEKIDERIKHINKLSLKQLINEYDLSDIFDESNLTEKVFITKGYITEEYKNYITMFLPGNLTNEDYEFVSAVKLGEQLKYDYKLEKIENVLKKLNEGDYENRAILNFDLLNYLLKNNYEKESLKIIEILNTDDDANLDFIDRFIEKYNSDVFINLLLVNSNKLWKKIYKKIGNKEYIDRWIMHFLENVDSLKNVDEHFNEYIETHTDIDRLVSNDKINYIVDSLKSLNIKLKNIQHINNKKFIEQIYLSKLYELNTTMIKLILLLNEIDTKNFENKNLTIIFSRDELVSLKEYVTENFEEYYNFCYTLNSGKEDEENIIMKIICNESIELGIRKGIIQNESFSNYNVEGVDRNLIDTIIDKDKLKISYHNLIYLLQIDGEIKDNIINNINLHIKEYEKESMDDLTEAYDNEMVEKLKLVCLFNPKINMDSFKILVKKFDTIIKEVQECTAEKIEYMINNNILEFNIYNFNYIKDKFKDKLVCFISKNISIFLKSMDVYDITEYKNDLLQCKEINKEDKISIANAIDKNLLNTNLISELMEQDIIDIKDKELNLRVLMDMNISIEHKVAIVTKILHEDIDGNEEIEYIHLIGGSFKDVNTSKKAFSIYHNPYNVKLCEIMERKGYISSCKNGKNNNIIIYNKGNR